jgi:adenylosuccinate lyase
MEDYQMIERYTLPEMGSIWTDENRLRKWLQIEVLACEAQARLGLIPEEALRQIQAKADFDLARVMEIESITHHDVIAFLTAVAEKVGDASKYIHMGMTSSDVLDTALALQMREAADLLLKRLSKLQEVLAAKAREYKLTLTIGRSHGIHAEPTTFGLKMALWHQEIGRHIERLRNSRETISVGMISGAVGTFANIDPSVEEYVCVKLGLKPAGVSTQIIQRDRHAEFINTLALIGSSLDKFATELRHLQRTEVLETEEPFAKGQKGSSAMPHKKNPIICERISGLARILRGHAITAMENVALWHERDISHSSAERVILPDSTILLDYMLDKFTFVMDNLVVHQENMLKNLEQTQGLVFSQRVLLALIDKGVLRETAYAWVQRNALKAWEQRTGFKELILNDEEIREHLTAIEIEDLFDYAYHLKNVEHIFERIGL